MSMKLELKVLSETSLRNDSLSLINWEIWNNGYVNSEGFILLVWVVGITGAPWTLSEEHRKSQLYKKVKIDDIIGQSFSKCGRQTTYISTIWEWDWEGLCWIIQFFPILLFWKWLDVTIDIDRDIDGDIDLFLLPRRT